MGKLFSSTNQIVYVNKNGNKKLGQGSYSEVVLVRHKNNPKKLYALKRIKNYFQYDQQSIRKEIHLHKQLNHPNVIKLVDYFYENKVIYILLEYASNGDLYKFLLKNRNCSNKLKLKFFHQTALAVQYIHKRGIMHRDIKPENILLDSNFNVKLCDFGWSILYKPHESRTTICGTYEYMAPEIFTRSK